MRTMIIILALTSGAMVLASPVLADNPYPAEGYKLAAAESAPSTSTTSQERASGKPTVSGAKEKATGKAKAGKAKGETMEVMKEGAAAQAMEKPKDFFMGTTEGYTFRYKAYPMSSKGATHNLMVTIIGDSGKPVTGATVAFDIVGPDKKEQKVMAVEAGDSYGAIVNLAAKGKYTIRTKVIREQGKLSLNLAFTKEVQ